MENIFNNKKILYVEDEKEARDSFFELLTRKGSEVILCENGKEGLDKFLLERPDIIITDIEMPVMNGMEMIKEIRKVNPVIPIIIITFHNEIQLIIDFINTNGGKYLLKPVNGDLLFRTIADSIQLTEIYNKTRKNIHENI